ncbi:putative NADPH-quinone reductase [Sphingobium olei]
MAELEFPVLRSQAEWQDGLVPADIEHAQQAIMRAEHLVILYPLWLGDMPALLKAFLEQVARPSFAFRYKEHGLPEKLLGGRSARVIVTMGMPGLFYRFFYRAHQPQEPRAQHPRLHRDWTGPPLGDRCGRECRSSQPLAFAHP